VEAAVARVPVAPATAVKPAFFMKALLLSPTFLVIAETSLTFLIYMFLLMFRITSAYLIVQDMPDMQ
jgi:hypothetical protein